MASGDKPDYNVKLPIDGVWHRLGAAWKSKREGNNAITIVLDVGAPITFAPGTKLVLTEPYQPEERESGQD